jgi:preprotein translocase subunit SecY
MIRVWHIPGYLRNASLADLLLSSMPTIAVIAASLLGLALAGISLLLQRVEGPASFRKSLADLLLRLSVAMLAITAGFFVFFGQRWLEDVNSQIDQANETLANMGNYMVDKAE